MIDPTTDLRTIIGMALLGLSGLACAVLLVKGVFGTSETDEGVVNATILGALVVLAGAGGQYWLPEGRPHAAVFLAGASGLAGFALIFRAAVNAAGTLAGVILFLLFLGGGVASGVLYVRYLR